MDKSRNKSNLIQKMFPTNSSEFKELNLMSSSIPGILSDLDSKSNLYK